VLLVTIALFFINGFCMSSGKILLEAGYADQQIVFYFVLFMAASLAINNKRSRVDLGYGSIIGVFNATANLSIVAALTTITRLDSLSII